MVIIMRGPSGSGKSTLSRSLLELNKETDRDSIRKSRDIAFDRLLDKIQKTERSARRVVSADEYFIKPEDGSYEFDRNSISDAHGWCLRRFVALVMTDWGLVEQAHSLTIVDNTNTTIGELAPYAALANAYGHELHVIELYTDDWVMCYNRNVHRVPDGTIMRQINNLERSRSLVKGRYGEFHFLRQ